jgi:hypothetical protein
MVAEATIDRLTRELTEVLRHADDLSLDEKLFLLARVKQTLITIEFPDYDPKVIFKKIRQGDIQFVDGVMMDIIAAKDATIN